MSYIPHFGTTFAYQLNMLGMSESFLLRLAPRVRIVAFSPSTYHNFKPVSHPPLADWQIREDKERDWVQEWVRQQQRRSGLRAGSPIRALVVVVVAVFACCDTLNIPLGQSTCLQSAVPYPLRPHLHNYQQENKLQK